MGTVRYWVYEVVNFDAAEIVVGVGARTISPGAILDAAARPAWNPSDRVSFRVVKDDLELDAAAEFAVGYCDSEALASYTVYLGPEVRVALRAEGGSEAPPSVARS